MSGCVSGTQACLQALLAKQLLGMEGPVWGAGSP